MHDATLCLLQRQGEKKEILLAMKKRSLGAGKYNCYGGKKDHGETIEEAAVRELFEESKVKANIQSLKKVGELSFTFPEMPKEKGWDQVVHVYVVDSWDGEPTETEEMHAPEWFSVNQIPYDKMWEADTIWMPEVLKGKFVEAQFIYGAEQNLIDKKLTIHDKSPWGE